MSITKKRIEAITYIELAYDENSKEFKELLEGFREVIQEDATIEDVMNQVCHHLIHFGYESMVEGVGYIKPKWKTWKEIPEPHSGIELLSDHFPSFDFEHN